MIKKLSLQNFKLFQHQSLEFSNLNLLTGLNGMGKSTVIQALLLLRDTFFNNLIEKQLNLSKQDFNNILFDAGKVKDVRFAYADITTIDFGLMLESQSYFWKYDARQPAGKKLPVIDTNVTKENLTNYSLFNENFCYLSAERIVPKNEYYKSSESIQKVNKFGNTGEYALNFLLENSNLEVSLKHPFESKTNLESQVNAWLREISPEINYHITPKGADKLHLDYSFFGNSTIHFDPRNVGFGITYTLPIIIALLSAQKGDLIIIENPESHLHPKGQSKLAELMCLAAQAGIQIFCETHSDHIVNGVYVAIANKILSIENSKIYFFDREPNNSFSNVTEIQVDQNGFIKNEVDNYFDQYHNDLKTLFNLRKNANISK